MEPAPRPSAVAPEAVARALTEALDPAARSDRPRPPKRRRPPVPDPRRRRPSSPRHPRPLPCARGRHARLFDRLAALWRVAGRATVAPRGRTAAPADGAGGTRDLRRRAEAGGAALRRLRGAVRGHDGGPGASAPARGWAHAQHDLRDLRPLTDRFSGGKRAGNLRFPIRKTRVFRPLLLGRSS
jgi:hypothetical protein